MVDEDDWPAHDDITDRLAEEVAPVFVYLLDRVAMDESTSRLVRAALAKAAFAGARVGGREAVAQLIEHGLEPRFNISVPDPSWDDLLADDE